MTGRLKQLFLDKGKTPVNKKSEIAQTHMGKKPQTVEPKSMDFYYLE